jgi:tRNA (guanosine-2'-O-)-methyltransferase
MATSARVRANLASRMRCRTLTCVLENPTGLVNIASVVRSCDVLGVGRLYIVTSNPEFTLDRLRANRKFRSLTCASIDKYFVRFFATSEACLQTLALRNTVNMVTSPYAKGHVNVSIGDAQLTASWLAVWFGNESKGISDEVLRACGDCIQIPMYGMGESLNLAICAGIVLQRATEQRRRFLQLLKPSKFRSETEHKTQETGTETESKPRKQCSRSPLCWNASPRRGSGSCM